MVEKPLVVCWQCGTAPDGTENPYFYREGPPEPDAESESAGDRTPFQFSLRTLLIFVTLWALFLGAWQYWGRSVLLFLAVVVVGNLFSAALGVIVTLILPKPDDSGNYP